MNPSFTLTKPSRVDLLGQANRKWLKKAVNAALEEYRSEDWSRRWGIPWVREAANVALYVLIVLAALSLPVWICTP